MESSVHPSVDFFLGATTPAGFKGYFAPLRREPGMQLVLLKSGPGCGKSTLMKRLARAAQDKGEPIQRIHCASDPDSLDGVVFLRQKRAIIDATAPHVVEPEAPGADERVLSLYHTIDADALHPHKDEVTALFARNQLLRSRAARYVASAGSLLLDSRRAEACSANFEKVRRYVKRLCTRLLPRTEEMGSEGLRRLSAITPKGEVFYQGTVQALADKCILFRDDYGAVSRLLLAARNLYARLEGRQLPPPPADTMCGALVQYLTTENKNFQPMGANMGILPPLPAETRPRDKRLRYMAQAERAVASFQHWLEETAL